MKRMDQRGIAVIFEVVAVAVVLVVIAIVGAKVYQARTGKSLINAVVPAKYTLNDKCVYNDPDLCKWINNADQFKSFAGTTTVASGSTSDISTFKVDGADKFQLTSTVGGKESYNYIAIGDTNYVKDYTDGKWIKTTTTPDKTKDSEAAAGVVDYSKTLADSTPANGFKYTKVGKEACGKLTCFKYEETDASDPGVTEDIWFDDSEYKLRKVQLIGGNKTITEFTYDNVSITAPSPTKDAAAAASAPTQAQIDAAIKQAQDAAAAAGANDNSSTDY